MEPLGIGSSGNIVYVGSGKDGRVDLFKLKGWRIEREGTSLGQGAGEFIRPVAIAVSPVTGLIHVADVNQPEVQVYDPNTLEKVGTVGTGVTKAPCGLAFNAAGDLFVSDMMDGLVYKFAVDGTYTKFTRQGKYDGYTVRPFGLAVDDLGQVYVVDAYYGRVQVYQPSSAWIGNIGAIGRGPGLMETPLHLVVQPVTNRMWVTDTTDMEVESFDPSTGQ